MHHAMTNEFGVLQPGNHSKHPVLLAEKQIRLESDKVVCGSRGIFGSELDDSPRSVTGPRIGQAHRLKRAIAQGIATRSGNLFNRLASREQLLALEVLLCDPLCADERVVERVVFGVVHRCIQVVGAFAFVVSGGGEDDHAVQRLRIYDRRRCIVEGQSSRAQQRSQGTFEGVAGEGPGRHDSGALRDLSRLFSHHGDQWVGLDHFGETPREPLSVHRKRTARRYSVLSRDPQHDTSKGFQFSFEQASRS